MPATFIISVIGAGNLGWSLAKNLEDAGHEVREVFSQDLENAHQLCNQLYHATPTDDPDFSGSESQIFLLALKDQALLEDLEKFIFPANSMVAHCSGSVELEILEGKSSNIGVFYPLQSFTKGTKVNFQELPLFVEANDYHGFEILEKLARNLSKNVFKANSPERKEIHLSAVFASNFFNHLLSISNQLLNEKGLNLEILKPLVEWTLKKAFEIGPENAQTGPAMRKDFDTIDEHLKMLEGNTELVELYENFTKQIMDLADERRQRDLKNT